VARLIDGTARHPRPIENAIVALARKSYEAPARLGPADLDGLRALVGDGALDYALVVSAFHFINRIADLLHVDPEALPAPLRRVEPLRRVGVWVASLLMRRMDLANRPFTASYEDTVAAMAPLVEAHTGHPVGDALASLRARPKIIETLRLAVEERDHRSTLDRATLARVHDTVEAALPTCREETEGFHARPRDPVEGAPRSPPARRRRRRPTRDASRRPSGRGGSSRASASPERAGPTERAGRRSGRRSLCGPARWIRRRRASASAARGG
jgi:hypothetical protein